MRLGLLAPGPAQRLRLPPCLYFEAELFRLIGAFTAHTFHLLDQFESKFSDPIPSFYS